MNDGKVVRPEDAIPDNANAYVASGGVEVRKGTVAAFIANARNLSAETPGTPQFDEVAAQLRALAPGLVAAGVFEVFELRSPVIREIVAGAS